MFDKDSWYLNKEEKKGPSAFATKGKKCSNKLKYMSKEQLNFQPAAVMFTPRSLGGELLTILRKAEARMQDSSSSQYRRLKIVEEGGDKIKHLLVKSDPWTGEPCQKPTCTSWSSNEGKPGQCRGRNVVYQNVCNLCKSYNKVIWYIGESAHTTAEREAKHQQDATNISSNIHMRDHVALMHPEQLSKVLVSFTMTKLKSCRSALSRQVREAVEIAKDHNHCLLNKKGEYNRYLLPALQVIGLPPISVEKERKVPPNVLLTASQVEEGLNHARTASKDTQGVPPRNVPNLEEIEER